MKRLVEKRMSKKLRFIMWKFFQAYSDEKNFTDTKFKEELFRLYLPYGISRGEFDSAMAELAKVSTEELTQLASEQNGN